MAARSRPRRGEQHEVVIDTLAYGGKGVARLGDQQSHRGMTVFVPRSAPGDRLRVRLESVRRNHAEASIVEVLAAGPGRLEPVCPHYEQGCGGCSWQHLAYEAQLAAKETAVSDSLERIGGFTNLPLTPIVAASEAWYYRNKMAFAFNAAGGLGLHVAGDWRTVVPVTECRLQSVLAMRIVEFARTFAAEHQITFWDPVARVGDFRELVIRHGRGSGQTMVGIVTSPGSFPHPESFVQGLVALDPSIHSIVHAVQSGSSDGSPIESVVALHGPDTILERLAGLSFRIGLQTFFQTSTDQAERMLEIVRRQVLEGLALRADDTVPARILDVFCGVGFFTLALAALAEEAIGVEILEASIIAARGNAKLNHIENAYFYSGDARRTLPEVIDKHGAPTVVVLDPPRSGAGGKVMRRIARSEPGRIVYVSCNPTTLARDLKELVPFGYRIAAVEPVDLFPQTYHVETIVALDRQ